MSDSTPRQLTWGESRSTLILLSLFGLMVLCGLPGLHGLFARGTASAANGALVPWGLNAAAYTFFAGISAGAFFVATLPHVFGVPRFAPLGRLSLFVAIVAFVAASLLLAVDVRSPAAAHVSAASPILFVLNGVYLAVLVTMLTITLRDAWAASAPAAGSIIGRWLAGRGEPTAESQAETAHQLKLLGIVGLVAVCFPGSLGTLPSRVLPLSFVLAAGTSGAALVLGIALLLMRGGEAYRKTLCSLGRLVGVLMAVEVVMLAGEAIAAARGSSPEQSELLSRMAFGANGWLFWGIQIAIGTILPLTVLLRARPSLRAIGMSTLLILVGSCAFRLNLALPQASGALADAGMASPHAPLMYVNFLLFCIGLAGSLFAVGYRLLPLVGRDVALEFQAAGGFAPQSFASVAALNPTFPGLYFPPRERPAARPRPLAAPAAEPAPVATVAADVADATAPIAFGIKWWLALATSLALLGFGVFSFLVQEHHGDIVTGMRTTGAGGAGWGLYVAFLTYFIGVSFAGTAVTALTHLFRLRAIRPLGRIAELMAILGLALAGVCILADQGRPLEALFNLPKYTKIMSPFFGTFVLMCTYLFANLVFFFIDGRADAAAIAARGGRWAWAYRLVACGWRGTTAEQRRHDRACFWLACATLVMLLAEQSTIGLIFGTQVGRPGWFSALQAPRFLVLAGVSSLGLLMVIAAIVRRPLKLEKALSRDTFRSLEAALAVLLAIDLYFLAAETFTSFYASPRSDAHLATQIVFGPYAGLFWTMVASEVVAFAALVRQLVTRATTMRLAVAAGVLVNLGVIFKRYLVVVPSQTRGLMMPLDPGTYSPTWVEYGVLLGALGLAAGVILAFVRVFPIVHVEHAHLTERTATEPAWSLGRRRRAFGATLVTGAGLALVALLSTARLGRAHYDDPAIPNSPMLFILGIATMLFSAVVYDALRTGRRPSLGPDDDEARTDTNTAS